MKTYTVGELIANFNDVNYIGYCYKGDLKDRLVLCDIENENRLYWIKSSGEAGYDFYFGVKEDIEIDEARTFVFFHEMDDYPEIKGKIIDCLLKAIYKEYREGVKRK